MKKNIINRIKKTNIFYNSISNQKICVICKRNKFFKHKLYKKKSDIFHFKTSMN